MMLPAQAPQRSAGLPHAALLRTLADDALPPAGAAQPVHPAGDAVGDGDTSHRWRAIWISDIHLGTPGCQARHLLDFLKHTESDTLYLVGDIVDGWALKRRWFWPQAHNDVVQKVLRKARKGTRVIFVPGNHDEAARQFVGLHFGGIEVAEEAVHQTADGKRLWITHGDLFDGVVQCARWLAYVGDWLYEFTLKLNRILNNARARMGMPYWSVSKYLKHKVKRAVNYVTDFERAVAFEARHRGLDGVVCGHIHAAEIREIDGTLYCNDGDWVESLTALVEHADGRLEIIDWGQVMRERDAAVQSALQQAQGQSATGAPQPAPASVPVSPTAAPVEA
jgi:UDP-2,3-diacylglucosamine pyrophosphatase LpxH